MIYFNDREKEGMTLKEAFDGEIEALKDMLSEGVVDIIFKKLDGTTRVMKATVCADIIGETELSKIKHLAEDDPRYIRVFDVNEKGWRTFYKDNVMEYSWANDQSYNG